jgi:hypothetical protein
MDKPDCTHTIAEQYQACGEGACPVCLEDQLRVTQLEMSVTPMAYKMLQAENKTLWKVIELLGGSR